MPVPPCGHAALYRQEAARGPTFHAPASLWARGQRSHLLGPQDYRQALEVALSLFFGKKETPPRQPYRLSWCQLTGQSRRSRKLPVVLPFDFELVVEADRSGRAFGAAPELRGQQLHWHPLCFERVHPNGKYIPPVRHFWAPCLMGPPHPLGFFLEIVGSA